MKFDSSHLPYASTRYPVIANRGMVCTGSTLASAAGLQILQQGGNAIDAAIATAACLTVVEPTANGIGSDSFAIVWHNNALHGINGSGYAPGNLTIDAVKAKHPDSTSMPTHGWTPVMVPGTPKTWATLSSRFGKLPLTQVLQPAIDYAQNGFPVSPNLARMWQRAHGSYQKTFGDDPQFQAWFDTFTIDGRPPKVQEIMVLPQHAKALELLAKTNCDAFYQGDIADALVQASNQFGGFLTHDDLVKYEVSFVKPMKMNYRGYDICEIPPNGQGIIALMALNILKNKDITTQPSIDNYHHQFESIKMAMRDGMHYITDPAMMSLDPMSLLSLQYGSEQASRINALANEYDIYQPPGSDTVYLCTADAEGNMVSYIQSNYMGFGSGIVVDGIALQNRGHTFSLDPTHANALQPYKKTYHTIIPGFLMKGEKAIGPFGIMGGYMQPQAHVQVAMNVIDYHLNPQAALDAPRWQWVKDKQFIVEPTFDLAMARGLAARGHLIDISLEISSFGRGQMILRMDNGTLVGGCDWRTDSNIACY